MPSIVTSIQEPATRPRTLLEAITARIPARLKIAAKLVAFHAQDTVHEMTVENVMGGMRGMPSILWEISETTSTGVKYHGKTLQELEELLPKWPGSEQLSPEAMLWYLYTASIPTEDELEQFTADLVRRAQIPEDVEDFLDSIPTTMAPIVQMNMAFLALSKYSKLSEALANGAPKAGLWKVALEDALDATARVPMIAARIHSNIYHQGRDSNTMLDMSADLAQNFAIRMGRGDDFNFVELTRLAWVLHQDHGANVSAHTMRLVTSAYTDPYSTLAAGLIAGSGALHAMAIQNALNYNKAMTAELGSNPTQEQIEEYVLRTIKSGAVLPGYGHAVLRVIDPRLVWIKRFIREHPVPQLLGKKPSVSLELIQRSNEVVPALLREHLPKIKNPAPNVDALSGSTMHTYGLEVEFIMVFMGIGRAMGFLTQSVWDKALGLPIERPLSITMDGLLAKVQADTSA